MSGYSISCARDRFTNTISYVIEITGTVRCRKHLTVVFFCSNLVNLLLSESGLWRYEKIQVHFMPTYKLLHILTSVLSVLLKQTKQKLSFLLRHSYIHQKSALTCIFSLAKGHNRVLLSRKCVPLWTEKNELLFQLHKTHRRIFFTNSDLFYQKQVNL